MGLRLKPVGASSYVLYQLLWPSLGLWSEKEKTNATMNVSEYAFASSNKPDAETVIRGQNAITAAGTPINVASPRTMASSRFACIHCFLVLIWTAGSVFPFFCLYAFALWMSA
jgi:hypothetical protein